MKRWIRGMRDSFFKSLFNLAKNDKNIILITADTGAVCLDEFRHKLKNQYINIGIAEQNMIGVAAGLAMTGKIVYCYAIVSFATMRCYEQIRIDLCCMNLPVTIVSIGAGLDYSTLGPTHHGTEDIALMRHLPNMTVYSPADSLAADIFAKISCRQSGPKYIRLDREGFPLVYKHEKDINIDDGFSLLKEGKDLYIIATGRMVYSAMQIVKKLSDSSIKAGVIDLFRIKPLNSEKIWDIIKNSGHVMTLEEHFITGGIGSAIAEILVSKHSVSEFKAFGIPVEFCRKYGKREYLQRFYKLDISSITESIKEWIK